MQAPNDRSSAVAVGSFAALATAAGGNQPAPAANAFAPMPLPPNFSQTPVPLSALTANSDFKAFQEATKEAANPASNIPPGPTPDLSQREFPAINVSTPISGA